MKNLHRLCLITLLAAVNPAWAGHLSYNFNFSGTAFTDAPNNAVAIGTITFDDTKLNNPGRNLWDPNNLYGGYGTPTAGLVTALSVTVTGSTGGNGIFSLADFDAVLFDTSLIALDLRRQLIGQPTSSPNGKTWGQDDQINPITNPPVSSTGDFLLFAKSSSAAPFGIYPFQVGTDHGNADGMQLVSFAPTGYVPEPGTFALFGWGLAAMGWARRFARLK